MCAKGTRCDLKGLLELRGSKDERKGEKQVGVYLSTGGSRSGGIVLVPRQVSVDRK